MRLHVEEDVARKDDRTLAWRSPKGKLGLAKTNRSGAPFRFQVDVGGGARFRGFWYTPAQAAVDLGMQAGPALEPELLHLSIEFWIEQ